MKSISVIYDFIDHPSIATIIRIDSLTGYFNWIDSIIKIEDFIQMSTEVTTLLFELSCTNELSASFERLTKREKLWNFLETVFINQVVDEQ